MLQLGVPHSWVPVCATQGSLPGANGSHLGTSDGAPGEGVWPALGAQVEAIHLSDQKG